MRISFSISPLHSFLENDILTLKSEIKRFGSNTYFTTVIGNSSENMLEANLMTSFTQRQQNDNSKILKSDPKEKLNVIEQIKYIPEFFNQYRLLKKNLLEELQFNNISFSLSNQIIDPEKVYTQISIAAPYLEVIEEMTLTEFFNFHSALKNWLRTITSEKIISIISLENAAQKQIRYFSSGMKQRVKLAQAIFSNTPIVLLDEPCTNLDVAGINLYKHLIENYCTQRLLIISSNDKQEYDFCNEALNINDFK